VLVVAAGIAGLAIAPVACHLADDFDAKQCPPGSHADNGRCLEDLDAGPEFAIVSAAGGCTTTPDSIRVAANAQFAFDNQDSVEHTVTGDDGKTWATAAAGRKSPLIGITKAGTYGFKVSGCAKGGTVVVE
jgi:plastocyanin